MMFHEFNKLIDFRQIKEWHRQKKYKDDNLKNLNSSLSIKSQIKLVNMKVRFLYLTSHQRN